MKGEKQMVEGLIRLDWLNGKMAIKMIKKILKKIKKLKE